MTEQRVRTRWWPPEDACCCVRCGSASVSGLSARSSPRKCLHVTFTGVISPSEDCPSAAEERSDLKYSCLAILLKLYSFFSSHFQYLLFSPQMYIKCKLVWRLPFNRSNTRWLLCSHIACAKMCLWIWWVEQGRDCNGSGDATQTVRGVLPSTIS